MIIKLPSWDLFFHIYNAWHFLSCVRINFSNIGRCGEKFARNWLIKNNFYILEQNWKIASGELDLVAIYGRRLHIVEVKTRNINLPEQFSARYAVDRLKTEKLWALAAAYSYQRINQLQKFRICDQQIDLLSIDYQRCGFFVHLTCTYFPAFSCEP